MEYEKMKEWLDKLVTNYKDAISLKNFNGCIQTCNVAIGIIIHQGIEIVADVMGIELFESERNDQEYPYEYSFVYEDVEFIQVSKERLESFVRM